MATTPMDGRGDEHARTTSADVAASIRRFNASNRAHEDLWTRTHQAGDAVRGAAREREAAVSRARQARDFHLAVQAEYPRRTAPLIRQVLVAGATITLDWVACWFAAQALSGGRTETLVWSVLFLAILAAGEVGLDHYSERGRRAWLLLVAGLASFAAGLGVLRFLYLATVVTAGAAAAVVGAALFTIATAGFLVIGYRTLRAAERIPCWQARRWSRQADRVTAAADRRVARLLRERNRLVDAYVSRIRVDLVKTYSACSLLRLEAALRSHLTGRDPS